MCTVRFVSDLVGNPEDQFSLDATHISEEMVNNSNLSHSVPNNQNCHEIVTPFGKYLFVMEDLCLQCILGSDCSFA